MNVTADRRRRGGLGTFGWDDEGVAARREPIVAGRYPARLPHLARDRGADRARLGRLDARRRWSRMPLVRMTNLHLEPGEGSLDELIAGVLSLVVLDLAARWQLGYWPHYDQPDPSTLTGPMLTTLDVMPFILFVAGWALWISGIAAVLNRLGKGHSVSSVVILLVGSFVAFAVWFHFDPGGIFEWWID